MNKNFKKIKRKIKTVIFRKKVHVKNEFHSFSKKLQYIKLMHWTYPKKIFLGILFILIFGACLLYTPLAFDYESYTYVNNEFIFNFKENDIDKYMNVNNKGVHYDFIDALFMASSAFTDTGFSLFTTGTHFSLFGQIIIFILIQVGGFGYISLFYLLGRAIRKVTKKNYFSTSLLNIERGGTKVSNSSTMITKIFIIILIIQLIFAFLISFILYFHPFKIQESWEHLISNNQNAKIFVNNFYIDKNDNFNSWNNFNNLMSLTFDNVDSKNIPSYQNYPIAFWHALFLSSSAINNAGFDLFGSNSLEIFRNDMGISLQCLVIFLIIVGGIGFPIIYDLSILFEWFFSKKMRCLFFNKKNKKYNNQSRPRFSSFTKMCLWSSFIITLGSIGILFSTEYINNTSINNIYENGMHNSLSLMSFPETVSITDSQNNVIHEINFFGENKELNKNFCIVFTSFSTRSAGFATVNMINFTEPSILILSILMFIGASPSSTGGGIRTTTFWVVLQSLSSWLRGLEKTSYAKRKIPSKTVTNAYLVLFISTIMIVLISMIVYITSEININGSNLISEEYKNKSVLYTFPYFLFECASAFGTTGLSIGICNSDSLQWWNLILLISLMFIGQLGISSTLLIFARKIPKKNESSYLEQDIRLG